MTDSWFLTVCSRRPNRLAISRFVEPARRARTICCCLGVNRTVRVGGARDHWQSAAFRHLTVKVKGIEYVPIWVYVRFFFCVSSLIRSPRSVSFAEIVHSSGAIRRIRASVLVFEGSCEQGPKTLRE